MTAIYIWVGILSVYTVVLATVCYIKIKSIYLNLFNLSKGLDILWENQQKILELTKVKGFVQLTHEEERSLKKEIGEEVASRNKKVEGVVRPPGRDTDDQRPELLQKSV